MDYFYEENAIKNGHKIICGIDEAGRGPLAGPVYAAAVILPTGLIIDGLNDSKKLSAKKRDELFEVIVDKAVDCSIGISNEKEIDDINILNATFLAMKRAVEGLKIKPDYMLIDGNQYPKMGLGEEETIIKGDAKSMSIAAASIIAKVSRDRFMIEQSKKYPEYSFEKHKGYGTKIHYDAIRKFGPSPIHRMSFLKKFYGEK